MDFKSLLSSRIAASKPATAASATSASSPPQSSSQYIRRADLEAARQKAYLADQQRLETERQEKLKRKREAEEEEAERQRVRDEKKRRLAEESRVRQEKEEVEEEERRRKRLGLPVMRTNADANVHSVDDDGEHDDDDDDGGGDDNEAEFETEVDLTTLSDIDDEDLQTRLRNLNQPATLPDETHMARLQRYYQHQAREARKTKQAANRKKMQKQAQKRKAHYPGAIPSLLAPLPADQIVLPAKPPPPTDQEAYLLHHRKLISYLNLVLASWQKAVTDTAPQPPKNSTSTSNSATILSSVLTDLTPLVHRLESLSLSTSLLTPLTEILALTQKRHYRSATDKYLLLSIGRAAWPIGVTMVGIHERSAREKLHENEAEGEGRKANILGDETMRRWLQAVKRCISFAQARWPPHDLGELMG